MFVHLVGTQFAFLLLQAALPNPHGLSPEQSQQIALEAIRRGTSTISLLVPFALFAMIVLIVWLGLRHKQTRIRARSELQKQLLDKFTSGQEFTAFIESAGGKRFLEELSARGAGPGGPLSGLRPGIILAAVGLGMLVLSLTRTNHGMLTPAVILLALGAGYLISTAVSYRLSKLQGKDQMLDHPSGPST